jgi:UDP-N-acetylmuramyl pentapeptide synthase
VEEHVRAGSLAAARCDALFTFGEAGRILADAAESAGLRAVHWFASKEEAAAALADQLRPGDHVLVKGSRSEALETIWPVLEGAR